LLPGHDEGAWDAVTGAFRPIDNCSLHLATKVHLPAGDQPVLSGSAGRWNVKIFPGQR
jgi:hypothetical protein